MILFLFLNFLFSGNDSLLIKKNEVKDFVNAVSITSDAKENIYILDATANQIVKYNSNLGYILRNGKQGWLEGQFDSPTSIDGSSGLDIFVSDGKNKRVQRFDLMLNPIAMLYTNQEDFPKDLRFSTPISTLVLNSNQLYVIDEDNNRIVVYKDGRNPANLYGFYSSGKGQLIRPVKLIKDGANNIYVFDKGVNSILKFDNLGNYVNTLTVNDLQAYTISGNILYMVSGKNITLYDLDKSIITGTKILPKSVAKKKIRDILVLNNKKYFLLGKNSLSLWEQD